jgi:GxxExxY protein
MSGERGGGYKAEHEKPRPVVCKDVKLDCGYRLDLVVEDKVNVEVKAIERLAPVHDAQLPAYLRASGKSVGLIINFAVRPLKNGLERIVNEFPDSARSAVSKKTENSTDL